MHRATLGLIIGAVLMAACSPKPTKPPPPAAAVQPPVPPAVFRHDAGTDLFGFYWPKQAPSVGPWRFSDLEIASDEAFNRWEGPARDPGIPPITLVFDDPASPKAVDDGTGGPHNSRQIVVAPTAYSLNGDDIHFAGTDPQLGAVAFDGTLDRASLAKAAKAGDSEDAIVRGTLKVGDKTFPDLVFGWFAGP